MPLEADGPPARNAAGSRRAARKEFHFQRADQDRQDSQDPQDMASRMLAHEARAKACLPPARQSLAPATDLSIPALATGPPILGTCPQSANPRPCPRPANPRRFAPPRHIPGGLGSPVRLGQGTNPAKRLGAYRAPCLAPPQPLARACSATCPEDLLYFPLTCQR